MGGALVISAADTAQKTGRVVAEAVYRACLTLEVDVPRLVLDDLTRVLEAATEGRADDNERTARGRCAAFLLNALAGALRVTPARARVSDASRAAITRWNECARGEVAL